MGTRWRVSVYCYDCESEAEFDEDDLAFDLSVKDNQRKIKNVLVEDGWYCDDDGDMFCEDCRSDHDGSSDDDDEDDDESSDDDEVFGITKKVAGLSTLQLSQGVEYVRRQGGKSQIIYGFKTRSGELIDALICPVSISWCDTISYALYGRTGECRCGSTHIEPLTPEMAKEYDCIDMLNQEEPHVIAWRA